MASSIAAGTSAGTAIAISGDTSGALQLQTNGTTTAVTLDTSQNATFAGKVTSAGALTLASNGTTTAVTIDTSQNVGIGTAVIRSKFASVNGTDNIAGGSDTSGLAGSFVSATGTAQQSTLSIESNDIVAANTGGAIGLGGRYNSTSWAQWAKISSLKDNATSGEYGGSLAFSTRANGASNTERMRIDSSGNLLVGTAASGGGIVESKSTSAGGECYRAWNSATTGTRYFHYFGLGATFTNVGAITSTGTITVFATTSDYRLKEDVTPMIGALATIAKLKPCNYKWIADGSDGQGFIAHEIQEVLPECVVGEKDAVDDKGNPEHQMIDTSFLVATLTAAIQEQQALIIQLQADVSALKGVK